MAWQFLFVLGAFAGRLHGRPGPLVPRHPVLFGVAGAVLGFALLAGLAVHLPGLRPVLPHWLLTLPVAKPHLPPLRLLHFFALTHVTVSVLGTRPRFLARWLARRVIGCGQQALPVFCAGILRSLAAHMVLVMGADTALMHAVVSLTGITLLLSFGSVVGRFQRTIHAPAPVLTVVAPSGRSSALTRSAPRAEGSDVIARRALPSWERAA